MIQLLIKKTQIVSDSHETAQAVFRWRAFARNGSWLAASGQGTLEELRLQHPSAEVTLLCSGHDVIVIERMFKAYERKHLARLLPYEIEPELASDLASVHVCLGEADAELQRITLAYADKKWLAGEIDALESIGFEVIHCVPEPLLLKADTQHWTLVHDDDQILLRWGKGQSCSIDSAMLTYYLNELCRQVRSQEIAAPVRVLLLAKDQNDLLWLSRQVSQSQVNQIDVKIVTDCVEDVWDALLPEVAGLPDLRSGEFAAPVRWQKFWKPVRLPLITAAAALLVFVIASVVEIQVNNQRFRQVQAQIEQVYRQAVPAGVLVDAEAQLRTQLAQLRGSATASQLMATLSLVSPALQQTSDIHLHRVNYSAAQGELQLGVSANSNADILAFAEHINAAGLLARPQNLSRVGDRQQASVLIGEARP